MSQSKILFVTNAEHGQANIQLAVISSLKQHHGDDLDIHLCSFDPLRHRTPVDVQFHLACGLSMAEGMKRGIASRHPDVFHSEAEKRQSSFDTTSPGFVGFLRGVVMLQDVIHPESPEEYVDAARSVEEIIGWVDPTLIVVDPFFESAIDAVRRSRKLFVKLVPNTLKDVAADRQGLGVFNWPAVGIGYSYPLSWWLLPINIIATLAYPVWTLFDSRYKAKVKARNDAGYPGTMPIFAIQDVPMLCVSTPAAEYPAILPEHIVLWKLQKVSQYDLQGVEEVGDRLRIVSWLEADPVEILRTGNVVCFVHHGGSNSYHEALATGTRQIVLSVWYDTHDFGSRVEWLGIGRWGNSFDAPNIPLARLTKALLDVVGVDSQAPEAMRIRERAREIGDVVRGKRRGHTTAYGTVIEAGPLEPEREGRDVAAEWIWQKIQDLSRN